MTRCRTLLKMLALVLTIGNILFLVWRWHQDNSYETISFIGLDSLSLAVPTSHKFAEFRAGEWVPDLTNNVWEITNDMSGKKRPILLVSLMPKPTYDNFIRAVRDLKARGICNIVVREGVEPTKTIRPLPDGSHEYLDIPAFVLCGQSIGDAGFYGELPPDRIIRR